jgi:methylmalonyl-CoA mutase
MDNPRIQASPLRPLRFVTATALFDGHDASIHVVRRLLQDEGVEVVHLGHNRSVAEVVEAVIQEDADGVCVSSYQGGHLEFFSYLVASLREQGATRVKVFGGGGGTITDEEAEALHRMGVERIYSVEDGRRLGPRGMIGDLLERCGPPADAESGPLPEGLARRVPRDVARVLTRVETLASRVADQAELVGLRADLDRLLPFPPPPVLGITGTGGAGKSSLEDELIRRFLDRFPERSVALLAVDPTRRRTGGALLGDRIRLNAARGPRSFVRSVATRRAHLATAGAVPDMLRVLRAGGFDLVILETAGIGQGDSEVVDLCDLSLYVMTPEFGAPTQLEKIDMLDFADLVVVNKADRRGAADALRDVRKQVRRNRLAFDAPDEALPVFATRASRFADDGVDRLFEALCRLLATKTGRDWAPGPLPARAAEVPVVVPPRRERYLAEVAAACRSWRRTVEAQAGIASRADGLERALETLDDRSADALPGDPGDAAQAATDREGACRVLQAQQRAALQRLLPEFREGLASWDADAANYAADEFTYRVRGKDVRVPASATTLSGTRIPKVALPSPRDWGDRVRFLGTENVPGRFPFTAGAFPLKRTREDPTRMFAGEGTAERTNRRFHYVSRGRPAARLSTAFDSPTLYGEDPDLRPDVYGKVGNSGVSICTLDDMKRLYSGFDLCAPSTSVSMTINGPAPIALAFFFHTAIDQAVERHLRAEGRLDQALDAAHRRHPGPLPTYRGELPEGHDGTGLALLGLSGADLVPAEQYARIRAEVLANVRGTVQADILKEDQAQNTCIFSTEFALKMMGDVQAFFCGEGVRNFYSVSISGYHIAEAGANPVTQLAFTLANGFTYVEYYRSRGLAVDDFAPNLSFFFSNGMDAEYAVIGRVARRIWAVALRDLYGAGERAQQLKYHIQTSGRSLHAREVEFNDVRTTLQALYAVFDNCQSLHTNAYDEAVTTPTEESVRRALAIQLILQREFGLSANENPWQGSNVIERLTDLVEEAVLAEFDRLSERGGVLGAMETRYQRGRIQDESLHYETLKHSGELPIVGVNTFLDPAREAAAGTVSHLIRSTDEEKRSQVDQVQAFQDRHRDASGGALERLRAAAVSGANVFDAILDAAACCTLGQITRALYAVGGEYRRNL